MIQTTITCGTHPSKSQMTVAGGTYPLVSQRRRRLVHPLRHEVDAALLEHHVIDQARALVC
jgi:hypothetical protein